MDALDTFLRVKNVELFLQIGKGDSIRALARKVHMAPHYCSLLIDKWERQGLVLKVPIRIRVDKIMYSACGLEAARLLEGALAVRGLVKDGD